MILVSLPAEHASFIGHYNATFDFEAGLDEVYARAGLAPRRILAAAPPPERNPLMWKRMFRVRYAAVLALAGLAAECATHPLGARFAIGMWPIPAGTPWTYQLLSGFVPALTVLTLLGSVLSLYHLHNCHEDRCWRLGKHRVNGTPWCGRHAVNARPERSVEELLEQILARIGGTAG